MKKIVSVAISIFCTGCFTHAQNVGIGTLTPNARLDINGDIALRSTNITITTTYNYALDVNTVKQSNYKLLQTGFPPVGNFIIAGITAGADGRVITLTNRSGSSFEMYNDDAGALAANRVITGTGTTFAVYNGGAVTLKYDTASLRWEVISSHFNNLNYFGAVPAWSLTGNIGTTSANFIGTNDQQALRFKVNGGSAGIIDSALGNTSLGVGALRYNVSGFNNIAIGKNALKSNIDYAQNNVAIGAGALENNIYGEGHVAIGFQALQNFVNINFPAGTFGANHNTAVGYKALQNNAASGTSNTAIGGFALTLNTIGINNTSVGDFSLFSNTTGANNVGLGAYSLYNSQSGNENVAIGSYSSFSNTGNRSTSVGFESLYTNTLNNNTAIGYRALKNAGSENNTAVGASALTNGGYRCTAIGVAALSNNQSFDNVAIGMNSLFNNQQGNQNTSCGTFALSSNTNGSNNAALGYFAMGIGSSGSSNIAVGYKSLYNNGGNGNIGVGYESLNNNNGGSYNTGIGYQVHQMNTTGSWNTLIGQNANASANNLDGVTAIGASTISNASNKIVLGANIAGMVIGGYANWSNLSDGRFKNNVAENVPGLDFIKQLRPVTYTIDIEKLQHHITAQMPDSIARKYYPATSDIQKANTEIKTGFIAQEVEAIVKKSGYVFDGVNAPKNSTDNYSIAYSQFVVPLVKAVQEQQDIIEKLQQQNELLLKRIEKLEKK